MGMITVDTIDDPLMHTLEDEMPQIPAETFNGRVLPDSPN